MIISGNITRFLEPNTDTDVIIPAKFLKRTALDGFEQFAFYEKRYSPETICEPTMEAKDYVFQNSSMNHECSLNHPNCKDATFLLTWQNFGCGSSREHAVYALRNYKVIIGSAPEGKSAFADIFRDNCRQNLIWTPVISLTDSEKLNAWLTEKLETSSVEMSLDIEASQLKSNCGGFSCSFELPDNHRQYLLAGLDAFEKAKLEISQHLENIVNWEKGNTPLLASSPNSSQD
jgi:3-isopropylmalate/(R)-2-methylmalate dehydratase small subunit